MPQTFVRLAVLSVALLSVSGCDIIPRPAPVYQTTGGGMSASLNVINRASNSLHYFYASSCSDGRWGPDQLGTETIPSGTSHAFSMTPGCWDLRATFADGQEVERRGVQLASNASLDWTIRD